MVLFPQCNFNFKTLSNNKTLENQKYLEACVIPNTGLHVNAQCQVSISSLETGFFLPSEI